MNIINTDIVDVKYDKMWDELPSAAAGAITKPVLIIVNTCEPGSAEDQQLLKMLEACKLAPEQYNILRLNGELAAWHKLREQLDPKIIFMIGVLPSQLGISALFQINVPNSFNDRMWLPTLSIEELGKNAELKKQLWVNGMKPLFVDGPILQPRP